MRHLVPNLPSDPVTFDEHERAIWLLVLAGFTLYEAEYDCHDHDIREWRWPYDEMTEHGNGFLGDEPWVILLRRAVEISQAQVWEVVR